jgi:hypothetical protein
MAGGGSDSALIPYPNRHPAGLIGIAPPQLECLSRAETREPPSGLAARLANTAVSYGFGGAYHGTCERSRALATTCRSTRWHCCVLCCATANTATGTCCNLSETV